MGTTGERRWKNTAEVSLLSVDVGTTGDDGGTTLERHTAEVSLLSVDVGTTGERHGRLEPATTNDRTLEAKR